MQRLNFATITSLFLFAACGRGDVGGLDPTDGSSSSIGDGFVPRTDSGDGFDGSAFDGSGPRFDGGPRDGGGGRDGAVRDFGVDGGIGECIIEQDCFELFGPPCPPGPGRWVCSNNACFAECEAPPPTCRTDCDCPSDLACTPRGFCAPLSARRNECCFNQFCPPGQSCVLPDGSRDFCPDEPRDGGVIVVDAGSGPDGGSFDAGPPPEWVGQACGLNGGCPSGFCIDEENGFPGGYCSLECGFGQVCPAGSTCQDFGDGQALCLDVCSDAGDCRPDYECVRLPFSTERTCWPRVPGSTNPNGAPVGDPCFEVEQCASGLTCFDQWTDGYCTRFYCDPDTAPCPSGSQCYAFPGAFSLCLEECPAGGTTQGCRPGYYCLGPTNQPGVCISN